jgi:hypothetical protein
MSSPKHTDARLTGRRTLLRLIGIYLALVVALGCAIWFELPEQLAQWLLIAALTISLVAATCVGRTVAQAQKGLHPRDRPPISGRDAGVLSLVAFGSLAIACEKQIYPRSWPTKVEDAVALLEQQTNARERHELAYINYYDLAQVHEQWSAAMRAQFGLARGNKRLLTDCDREHPHPDTCASVILSRLWRRARAELPPAERDSLEDLEKKMERVRVKTHKFRATPLADVVAFFNEAIHAQLPEAARFAIRYDPDDADIPVTTSWYTMDTFSLRETLGVAAADAGLRVRKAPPDVVIEAPDEPPR